jgi:hypothetical protein
MIFELFDSLMLYQNRYGILRKVRHHSAYVIGILLGPAIMRHPAACAKPFGSAARKSRGDVHYLESWKL